MKKRLWMSLGMVVMLGQAHASTSGIEYNIANGLSPIVKDQSISVLQPFYGNFRILGSKMYSQIIIKLIQWCNELFRTF